MASQQTPSPVVPTDPTRAATNNYVDNVAQGLAPKQSVRVLASANLALSGTQTVDGVALSAGDTVLCIAQTTGSPNDSYTVAAGARTRPPAYAHLNHPPPIPYSL